MTDICIRKYKNYQIYLHNFSKFDGTFLLKKLSNIKNSVVDPVVHDGKIISVQFHYNNYIVNFRDSYLLLPSSLKDLCLSFNNKIIKDLFPVLFNDIDYIGEVPDIKYFKNITIESYNEYCIPYGAYPCTANWNFREESIKYCIIDCVYLYEILIKFNHLIFNKFQLNINNYPTLPSLSFANYRCNYLPSAPLSSVSSNSITGITGQMYDDIKESYTGGSVDMYIPSNNKGESVYCYDVN